MKSWTSSIYLITVPVLFVLFAISACAPTPGPDKTIAGAALGAAWGAGAGAVVGHQVEGAPTGEGVAIGAGFGAVSGAMSGLAYDAQEDVQIQQEQELASLRIQNTANAQMLSHLQARLDQAIATDLAGGIYQVFFDPDSSTLRSGAIANLEVIADSIRTSPSAYVVNVVGHADDAGTPTYNQRLAESRARAVSAYLSARGISMDQLHVSSYGSKRPIASNVTEAGRQLNRRVDIFIGRHP
ncbi:MAG: OmpA family protein [Deltaproteobacteria bacterium]|nr:OmpA family protein [Deltaproteobacteria bacterium]